MRHKIILKNNGKDPRNSIEHRQRSKSDGMDAVLNQANAGKKHLSTPRVLASLFEAEHEALCMALYQSA